jgi:ABC-type lipoprotein release transport system permease subunit
MFFTHALRREATAVLSESPEIVVQRMTAGRHDLMPASYADGIRKIKGVAEVTPRLWGYYYDQLFGSNYTIMVPSDFRYGAGEIAVGEGVTRAAVTAEGNLMPFFGSNGKMTPFKIREVLPVETELISSDLILMSGQDFRALFSLEKDLFTDIAVSVRNPQEVLTVAGKIRSLFPDTRPILRDEIIRTYDAVFDWRSGILLVIFSGALLAFIIFSWDKASGLSPEERREIGILKATGWETSDIIQMKFWEGIMISGTSFLVGLILAYLHVFFASASLFEPVIKGWSVIYPKFRLIPFVSAYQVATLFFVTVVPYTVATIIPSWKAAVTDPDEVMRN